MPCRAMQSKTRVILIINASAMLYYSRNVFYKYLAMQCRRCHFMSKRGAIHETRYLFLSGKYNIHFRIPLSR